MNNSGDGKITWVASWSARRDLRRAYGLKRLKVPSPTSAIYLLIHVVVFLVGFLLSRSHNTIVQAVGASIIAAGVTGWLLFVTIALNQSEKVQRAAAEKLGLVATFDARSVAIKQEYDRRTSRAREHIDVMGFGLSHLREEYLDQMHLWAQVAIVRILLIDPGAEAAGTSFADQRDIEESQTVGTISEDVKAFLAGTFQLRHGSNGRFAVRLCKALPSVNMFRIDYEAFWGPYLVAGRDKDKRSRNLPTFIVDHRGMMFARLCEHFNTLWESEEFSRRPDDETW